MEMSTKATGLMGGHMVMVSLSKLPLVQSTMANGQRIYKRAKVQRLGIMENLCILVTSRMVRRQARVSSSIKIQSMRVNLSMDNSTARENITIHQLREPSRVLSKITISLKAGCFLRMAPTTKGNIRRI